MICQTERCSNRRLGAPPRNLSSYETTGSIQAARERLVDAGVREAQEIHQCQVIGSRDLVCN